MAVVAVVALVGLVVRDAMSGQAEDSTPRTTTVVGSANTTGGPPTAVSASGTATDSASPAPAPAPDPVAAQLPACRTEIAAVHRLATAADASYQDWNAHVSAQLGLDGGSLTAAQARARWAASKVRGPRDTAAFTREWSAYRAAIGGCGRLGGILTTPAAGGPAPVAANSAVARACVQRAGALAGLAAAGKAVNDDWSEHVAMMARKQDTTHAAYSARWQQMVRDAVPLLANYRKAKTGLAAAPACPTA